MAELSVVFFLSGFAAFLYQVVWQRALYAIFGITIESVTVVVTAFLLGLGLGSLIGGVLSKSTRWSLLMLFGLAELIIGIYGAMSLSLFRWVGSFTLHLPFAATAVVMFMVVLAPTMLMGGTLPILVAYTVRRSHNVGRSVGSLYFVNTLGSAISAFVAVIWALRALGEQGSVLLAAAVNIGVAMAVVVRACRSTATR